MERIDEPDGLQLEFSRRFPNLMLASSSPNRKALLEKGGTFVKTFAPETDEDRTGTSFKEIVENIAKKKLEAYLASPAFERGIPAVAADTLVLSDGTLIGKPADEADAYAMLSRLSGRGHMVISAVGLYLPDAGVKIFSDEAAVFFRNLDRDTVLGYISTGEWMGAAGAYRLQKTGYRLVERIDGDWTTVVGLPLGKILAES